MSSIVSNYPNGFSNGVLIRGLPVTIAQPGNIRWVNNSSVIPSLGIGGSNNNSGSWDKPWATIAYAVSQCTAGRGDIIMCMPGHAETVSSSTAMSLGVSGALVFGCGMGALRPTITLNTATSATINITAAQMGFYNVKFVANFASIASLFTLAAGTQDFYLGNCNFVDTSSILNFVNLVTTSTTSNASDGFEMDNCAWNGLGAASNTCAFNVKGTNDRWSVNNNYITHAATTTSGLAQVASSKSLTNLTMDKNILNLASATNPVALTLQGSSNTGVMSNNLVFGGVAAGSSPVLATASSGLKYFNNYYDNQADHSGALLPAVGP
jgi:hypothetical protein